MQSGSISQAQVVCVPPAQTHGPAPDFLLKPAPSAAKYRNKRRLLQHLSPPPSSTLRHQPSSPPPPPSSLLQFFDTPSPIPQSSPKSASAFSLSSAIPSPPIDRPKRHARAFDKLPFTFAPSPSFPPTTTTTAQVDDHPSVRSEHDPIEEEPRYSSEATLYDPANEEPSTQAKDPEQQEDSEHFTFLHSDPYASAVILKYPSSHSQAPQTLPLSAWTSFFHRSPPPPLPSSPRTRTSRNRSLSSASFSALKPKNPFKSIPNPFKIISIMPSSSSSSSNRPSSSRKVPEKVLPFTTQQIAELDRLMGNSKAAKGKVASQYAPGTHSSSSEKHYIAPYVPLNGSAPSGTRSFGRDGEHHPIGASTGTSKREVGVQGESIPYLRDENGVMWSGQEEMDEYQQLLDQAEARRRRKAAVSHIDTRRSSEDSWKQFDPTASSVDSSSSVLRSAGSTDVFDLGYDDAVMIPEGGAVKLSAVSTVGGLTKASGPVTLGPSTRGVESFPAPQSNSTSSTRSASSTPRPKGADRRIRPGTAPQPPSDPVDGRAAASQTSLGTIRPTLPLDQEGKMEFFGDAFAPPPAPASQRSALPPLQPIQPSATWGQQAQPSPGLTPKSKLHRHSTSLAVGSANFFQNLVNAHSKGNEMPASPLSPTSPSYLAPLPHPDKYSGLRQASFSGPGGFAAKGSLRSPTFAPPPVPALPPKYVAENLKTVKKKSSSLGVAQMFKKLTKV